MTRPGHLIPKVSSTDKEEVILKAVTSALLPAPTRSSGCGRTGLLVRWKIDMTETRSYPRHLKTEAGDVESA